MDTNKEEWVVAGAFAFISICCVLGVVYFMLNMGWSLPLFASTFGVAILIAILLYPLTQFEGRINHSEQQ